MVGNDIVDKQVDRHMEDDFSRGYLIRCSKAPILFFPIVNGLPALCGEHVCQGDAATEGDAQFVGNGVSGKQFHAVGITPEGIAVETDGKLQLLQKGRFSRLWLRVTNDCPQNRHQFAYSTDGEHFTPIGESFPMRWGYWKGIRTALFCYGTDGKACFDEFIRE